MSFLISSKRHFERNAVSEAFFVINDTLKYECNVQIVSIPGLIILNLVKSVNPKIVMEEIKNCFLTNSHLTDCLKIVPIEIIVKSDHDLITHEAIELSKGQMDNKTWMISVKKRHTKLSSNSIKKDIADVIYKTNSMVDLSNPEIEIRIEIIGKITGISIMKPSLVYRKADQD